MESEASAIARRVRNYLVVANHSDEVEEKEHGIMTNILLISLMGIAVLLTEATLMVVKWIKSIEE